ncbi:MAG: amidophosphoribosyltransferase, partial [Christensenellaceae bacterium]|nr:amidophosphoribosyltransferase [Christensenellaceae bacterium]
MSDNNNHYCCRSINEECGIVGILSREKKDIAHDIYYGLFALQHRGQESAGIALHSEGKTNKFSIEYHKGMGLVGEVFSQETLGRLPHSRVGIGHTRYSTTGSSHLVNAQPVVFYGRKGRMAVAHNGNIANALKIKEKMLRAGHIFLSSTDSEVVASLINYYSADDIEKGIRLACSELVGAYALVITAEEKLYAVRDPLGLKPLVLGLRGEDVVFASESCALAAVGATLIRDVEPGEIVKVDTDGVLTSTYLPAAGERKSCVFEYV